VHYDRDAKPLAEDSGWIRLAEQFKLRLLAQTIYISLPDLRSAYPVFKEHCLLRDNNQSALRDGLLGREELGDILGQIAGVHCKTMADIREVMVQRMVDRAFQEAEREGYDFLDFRQFVVWLSQHSFDELLQNSEDIDERLENRILAEKFDMYVLDIENYRRQFKTYDLDGSGDIDRAEFSNLMYSMTKLKPGSISTSRMQDWWRAADTDGSGQINFLEFCIFHQKFFSQCGDGKIDMVAYYSQAAARPGTSRASSKVFGGTPRGTFDRRLSNSRPVSSMSMAW
jgi:Ca2+-binding EF-hand superfamily protein